MEEIFKIHNKDARLINSVIKDEIVDVTISSPPYYDLKDYGSDRQIGYGQEYDEYLDDLKAIFKNVFNITKDTGTLWVIIDAYRRNGEVVPLPFDFSNKISQVGWKLQEVIIWGKDRTLPWAHQGQMRNLFEYILVFSKSKKYTFNISKVRDFENLKKWWIKYPERYNPRGKTPDAIWNFDIPTQGSWGNGYIKHFCPLPEEMIEQILKITTNENDVVLDPFSGSGAVLSKAINMKRRYIGFELNMDYIEMFNKYIKETGNKKRLEYEKRNQFLMKQNKFEKLILNLRALKYSRIFYNKLNELKYNKIIKIEVVRTLKKTKTKNKLIIVEYNILTKSKQSCNKLERLLNEIVSKPPLSKFGIEPKFSITHNADEYINSLTGKKLYVYTNKVTHFYKTIYDISSFNKDTKQEIILSKIKVNLNEKDYE